MTCIEESYTKSIEKEKEFPDHIRNATKEIKKKIRLNNLKFKGGIANDLEGFFKANPDRKNDFCGQLPSYVVQFDWKELSLGIGQYEIHMLFDSYGQLIKINYPLDFFQKKYKCNSLDFAFQKADSLIRLDSRKFYDPHINLEYIKSENDLVWTFEYNTIDSVENVAKKVFVNLTSEKYRIQQLKPIEFELVDDIELDEEIIPIKK